MWTNGMAIAQESHRAAYGENHLGRLMDQTIEEAAELIAAIQQSRRGRASNIVEECADLYICVEFLRRVVDPSGHLFTQTVNEKIQVLQQRLDAMEMARK